MSISISKHQIEIEKNRDLWRRKPLLRKIYKRFYDTIKVRLNPGVTLELGSGIGQIKTYIPDCITSDLYFNPDIDRVESAYELSFENLSIDNIVLFDVWHHIQYPGAALRECYRVLAPGGRLIIFEPAMGFIPQIVYRLFHHEPLGLGEDIEWEPPTPTDLSKLTYFAAQSRAWRIFHQGEGASNLKNWAFTECLSWSDIAYLGSGGFSKPSLYPISLLPYIESLDRLFTRMSKHLFSARMLVVLNKK